MDLQPKAANFKPLVFLQNDGESIRSYMWRVESLLLDLGFDMDEFAIVRVILRGLLPDIAAVIPDAHNPFTRQNLLQLADNLHLYLPKHHSYWTSTSWPGDIVPVNLIPPPPTSTQSAAVTCYKCGELNHYAYYCTNKRNRTLRRKKNLKRLKLDVKSKK